MTWWVVSAAGGRPRLGSWKLQGTFLGSANDPELEKILNGWDVTAYTHLPFSGDKYAPLMSLVASDFHNNSVREVRDKVLSPFYK